MPAELGALPSAPSARPSSARGPVWARASPHRGGLLPPWWEEGPQSSRHPLTRAPEAGGLAAGGHAEAQVSHESQTWRRVVRRHRWKGRNEGTGGKRAGHTSRKGSGRGDPRLQGQKPPPQNQNWSPPYGACPPVSLPRGGFRGQSDGREPRPRAKHRARSLPTPPPPSPGRAVECVPSVFTAGSVGPRRYRTSASLSSFLKPFSPSFLGPQAASPGPTQDPTADSSRQARFPAPCSSVGSEDGERPSYC